MRIYAIAEEYTSPRFAAAMSRATLIPVRRVYEGGGWIGFGSPKNWDDLQKAISSGQDWYYGDHGYFERGQYYRITHRAYQHTGEGTPDLRRARKVFARCEPWRTGGREVIVCAQSQNHYDRFGVSSWLEDTLAQLRAHTDRPIVVRYKRDIVPLSSAMRTAWCVVGHTTNSAVDAIMYGVPSIVTHQCAASLMARSSLADIERPLYAAGRLEWAGVLAANQWTMAEIASGIAWKQLKG